jgi:uncharacterized OB-fold protein
MEYTKPVPVIDHLSEQFWAGCREHQLRLQRCLACKARRFPAGPECRECGSPDAEWVVCEGRARVYSWIVVRHPVPADIYAAEVPYVVALVEFDDGVRMPTNIVGCSPEEITAGMEVDVSFNDISDTITLPVFRPVVRQPRTRPRVAVVESDTEQ